MILARITREIIEIIRPHAPVMDIGAGDGAWTEALLDAGVAAVAVDPVPRGPAVRKGTHADLPDIYTPLIVWPPDGINVGDWIAGHKIALICGNFGRFRLPPHELKNRITTNGIKGPCYFAEVYLK